MKTILIFVLKVIALTITLAICFTVFAGVLGPQAAPQDPAQGNAASALLLACLLSAAVLTHIIVRSRWRGWRLMVAVFFVLFGVMTVMPQMESAVFLTHLPAGMVPRLFLMGALIAASFAVLAVLLVARKQGAVSDARPGARLVMSPGEWAWKLAVIACAYLILYFTFGYFIAWRNPAVLAYYGGVDDGRFFAQMRTMLETTPWLIPLQVLRAMLWVAIALPVVRMMKGGWPEIALALGLLFAVVMNAWLLLPNAYMPEAVRMAHLTETASSNFIFGLLMGWLLAQNHNSSRNPIRRDSPS